MKDLLAYTLSSEFNYEECFKRLKTLNDDHLLSSLNTHFKTNELLDYDTLRLFGYRKLSLPECKSAMIEALRECLDAEYELMRNLKDYEHLEHIIDLCKGRASIDEIARISGLDKEFVSDYFAFDEIIEK